MVARGGVGAIGADEEVEVYLFFWGALVVGLGSGWLSGVLRVVGLRGVRRVFEPGGVVFEVGACELVVEVEGDIWHGLQGVKETFVQPGSVDGVDGLGCVRLLLGKLAENGTYSAVDIIVLGVLV